MAECLRKCIGLGLEQLETNSNSFIASRHPLLPRNDYSDSPPIPGFVTELMGRPSSRIQPRSNGRYSGPNNTRETLSNQVQVYQLIQDSMVGSIGTEGMATVRVVCEPRDRWWTKSVTVRVVAPVFDSFPDIATGAWKSLMCSRYRNTVNHWRPICHT